MSQLRQYPKLISEADYPITRVIVIPKTSAGNPEMQMKEKENPPPPTQLDLARLLESVEIEDWIQGSEKAARYLIAIAIARDHDPHLRQVFARLDALHRDVADIATDCWPLLLVEVEQDLEGCLQNWPENLHRFSLELVENWSGGQIEWKPAVLLRLARGRLERGEGDAEKLALVVAEVATLVERARGCMDEHKIHAWQRELQERFERQGAAA